MSEAERKRARARVRPFSPRHVGLAELVESRDRRPPLRYICSRRRPENLAAPARARARSLSLSLERLVESWAEGCAWNELLASTSLAEGDVCRLVRRTIDVLRSFAVCAELPAQRLQPRL